MPPQVCVGHMTYRLTQDLAETPHADNVDSADDFAGMTFHKECVIWIRSNIPEVHKRETLLHELMHAVLSTAGLDHTLEKELREGCDREEAYISGISPGLFGTLRDNPQVTKWIMEVV